MEKFHVKKSPHISCKEISTYFRQEFINFVKLTSAKAGFFLPT